MQSVQIHLTNNPQTIAGSGSCRKFEVTTNQNTTMTNLHSPSEIFKPIIGYEGYYEVSNYGRVKAIERRVPELRGTKSRTLKEKILSPRKSNKRYLVVNLCRDSKAKNFKIHRLVASAFLPPIEGYTQVNHIDGNQHNNNLDNLEWTNNKLNHIHRIHVLGQIPGFMQKNKIA